MIGEPPTIYVDVSQVRPGPGFFAMSRQAPGCWGYGETAEDAVDEFVAVYDAWKYRQGDT